MRVFLRWAGDMLRRFFSTLDWVLCLALGALMVIGLATLKSAGGDSLVMAQGARFAVGMAALWGISRVPILRIRSATPMIYAISMIPLLAVFVLGTGKYGRQWLDLKFFYLQPAELLKVSLPMMVAWYLHKMPLPPRFNTVLVALIIIGVPTGLVMLQPDFGTGVLIAASGVFVLLLAGLPWWWVGLGVGGVAAVAPVAWFWLLRPYQKDRIMMFLDPEMDALGAGWNIIQSKIAIGSGGFDGKGWGEGSQSHLNFIPEQTTDFAFSVLSEEFGWIGVATVLALYLVAMGFLFAPAGGCHRPGVLRLRAGEWRDDFRPAAGGRRADAADQLRWYFGGVATGRLRAGDGGAQPQSSARRLRLSPASGSDPFFHRKKGSDPAARLRRAGAP